MTRRRSAAIGVNVMLSFSMSNEAVHKQVT